MSTINAELLLNNTAQDILYPKTITDQILVSPENTLSLTLLLSKLIKNAKKVTSVNNLHGNLPVNSFITVPKYIVGSGLLSIFLNGIKANINETYEEVGEIDTESTSIKIITNIPQHIEIESEVLTFQY